MEKFLIIFVIVKRQNRHAIWKLETKRVSRVVNEQYVVDISIPDNSQILNVYAQVRE